MGILFTFLTLTLSISSLIALGASYYLGIHGGFLIAIFITSLYPATHIARMVMLIYWRADIVRKSGKTKREIEYIVKNRPQKEWHV